MSVTAGSPAIHLVIEAWLTRYCRGAVARALEKAGELVQRSRLHPAERRLREASMLAEEVSPALVDMDAPVKLLGALQQTLQAIAGASQVLHLCRTPSRIRACLPLLLSGCLRPLRPFQPVCSLISVAGYG
jgi:hypothetical protein